MSKAGKYKETKLFKGKKYKLHNKTISKFTAFDSAKAWRKQGYDARVTKARKWLIWVRKK